MSTKKELLEKSQKSLMDYFELSKYLFGDEAPYEANEIPSDSPFYSAARNICEDLELNWKSMSHEDSNRVFINLLADYFAAIQVDENYIHTLKISLEKKK